MKSDTSSPEGARAHARAQAGRRIDTMPIVPPSEAEHWPARVQPGSRLWAETIAGGGYTGLDMAAGTSIEFTDLDGDACAHVAVISSLARDERLNVADTMKVQWQAYPEASTILLSDRGRALATITEDESGCHDALTGTSTRGSVSRRHGDGAAHSETPAGRELLLLAAAKQGLEPRDLPPTITLFRGVTVDADGVFSEPKSAGPGCRVVLRADMPIVILVANVPHPLDSRDRYVVSPLRVRAWIGDPAPTASTVERARAYANTRAWATMKGIA